MTSINWEQFEAVLGVPLDTRSRRRLELFVGGTERIQSLADGRRLWFQGLLAGAPPHQLEEARLSLKTAVADVRLLFVLEEQQMVGPVEPLGTDPIPS